MFFVVHASHPFFFASVYELSLYLVTQHSNHSSIYGGDADSASRFSVQNRFLRAEDQWESVKGICASGSVWDELIPSQCNLKLGSPAPQPKVRNEWCLPFRCLFALFNTELHPKKHLAPRAICEHAHPLIRLPSEVQGASGPKASFNER